MTEGARWLEEAVGYHGDWRLHVYAILFQAPATPPHKHTVLPHPATLPANVSHTNQSRTNNDCPAWFILRSSNPNPKGSVDLEFRDELKGG